MSPRVAGSRSHASHALGGNPTCAVISSSVRPRLNQFSQHLTRPKTTLPSRPQEPASVSATARPEKGPSLDCCVTTKNSHSNLLRGNTAVSSSSLASTKSNARNIRRRRRRTVSRPAPQLSHVPSESQQRQRRWLIEAHNVDVRAEASSSRWTPQSSWCSPSHRDCRPSGAMAVTWHRDSVRPA